MALFSISAFSLRHRFSGKIRSLAALVCLLFCALGGRLAEAENFVSSGSQSEFSSEAKAIESYFWQRKTQMGMGGLVIFPMLGQNPQVIAALIAHQQELSSDQVQALLFDSCINHNRNFLPLLRREVAAPRYNPQALALFSDMLPEEARPIVIADLLRDDRLYQKGTRYPYTPPDFYLRLPDRPIPELTNYFREQLEFPVKDKYEDLFPLIDRYGTPDLLPAVLKIFRPRMGIWLSRNTQACLRFWIRCHPSEGLTALATLRAESDSYSCLLLEIAPGRWTGEMQQFTLNDLHNPYLKIAASAIQVLGRYGDVTVTEAVVSTYLQMATQARRDPATAKIISLFWYNASSGAKTLLDNTRLPLNQKQKMRLLAVAKDESLPL